jgi:hemerythrin-like domain-containing protein
VRTRLARFAGHARRHLILENAIILPFARLRLTRHDLETLRLRMMQRRGLDRLMETVHAE